MSGLAQMPGLPLGWEVITYTHRPGIAEPYTIEIRDPANPRHIVRGDGPNRYGAALDAHRRACNGMAKPAHDSVPSIAELEELFSTIDGIIGRQTV